MRWIPALAGLMVLVLPHDATAQAPPAPTVARPLTDSVRPYLVIAPTIETWFVAANRGKRMMLDIGRVDLEVRKDSALAQAYRQAVAEKSHIKPGATFVLRAPWGSERVRAKGVDTWNGRIVLVLEGSAQLDSAAADKPVVVGAAQLDTGKAAGGKVEALGGRPACARFAITPELETRLTAVKDSLEYVLKGEGLPIYDRLIRRLTTSTSRVTGCFGAGRVLLAVSLRAGYTPTTNEWTRERVVLVAADGAVVPLKVQDFRFRVHDLVHALDADGDGIDDVAAIGRTFLAGGTTVLRYDPKEQKLTRVSSGFSWEER